MRKKIYPLLLFLIPGLWAGAQNIAVNGGFEDSAPGVTPIPGWNVEIDASATAVLMVTDQDKYEGNNSLLANVTTPGNSSWHIQIINEPVYLDVGEYYRFSVRTKTTPPDSSAISFTVGAQLPGDSYPEMARLGGEGNRIVPPNEWRLLSVVVKAPYDSLRVPIHFHEPSSITYIDDLQIIKSHLAVCEVDESGDTLTLNFGWDLAEPSLAFDLTSIKVMVNGNLRNIESLSYGRFGNFVNVLKLKMAGRIGAGAEVTVSYTKPDVLPLQYHEDESRAPDDLTNKEIEEFTDEVANNLSTAVGVNAFKARGELYYYVDKSLDVLTVTGLDKASRIDIYSITGQLVKYVTVTQNRHVIPLSGMNRGVYVLSVAYANGATGNGRFIK